jgi:hypothetical protein
MMKRKKKERKEEGRGLILMKRITMEYKLKG